MAAVMKLGDAGLGGLTEQVGKCSQLLQLSSPIQLPWLSWGRSSEHRNDRWFCAAKLGIGKPQLRMERSIPFRPAALPLDRRRIAKDGGSETGPEEEDLGEPWLGAVVFKRSAVRSHYEFHTSLERLGLGFLSTDGSRNLADLMGLKSAASSKSVSEECTPVNISIDVSRDDDTRDLRLDGIARTTMGLCCNRCLTPVVERVFAEFSLLLSETPVTEPTQQRIGVVLGENSPEHGPVLDLELDDKLYFPKEAKEMDLSKYLRDSVHLEIPYKSLCSTQCLGLCLTCGVNLNKTTCKCTDVAVKPSWGPLDQLKTQLKMEKQAEEEGGLQ